MIHYHGTPITPEFAAAEILKGRHAMVSFAHPDQVVLVADICQSFVLDNGAFSAWKQGRHVDWAEYISFVRDWYRHPAFDWAIIPDVIDGDEQANDDLLAWWVDRWPNFGVPVWHMHESIERLYGLCQAWPRVALGSSGEFASVGTAQWWGRMGEAMERVTENGYPICKLHGLRMLDQSIFTRLPVSSGDSATVAVNIGLDVVWAGRYKPPTKAARGVVLAERIESRQSAATWKTGAVQEEFQLVGT